MSSNKRWTHLRAIALISACAGYWPLAYAATIERCVGDSPISVTRWVWKHSPQLTAANSDRFVSAAFLSAIRGDIARAKANDDICGLCGGDLWTDSQEGYARAPMDFKEAQRAADSAEVVYSFRFSVERTGPSEPRNTRILLRKERGCWKIDDIVHGSGSLRSLVSGT
jgi:hypothetical protein